MATLNTKVSTILPNSSQVKARRILQRLKSMSHEDIQTYVDNQFSQPDGPKKLTVNIIEVLKAILERQ